MHLPTFFALSMVISSHRTPATPEDLASETSDLLIHQGFKPDREEIRAAILGAVAAGRDALLSSPQPDGTFRVSLDPPKLLAISERYAVPLRHVTRADALAHIEYMKLRRIMETMGWDDEETTFWT